MPDPDLAPTDLSDGWECFTRADWTGARDVFAAQLATAPGDAEALDGHGQALWWLGERDAGIGAGARPTSPTAARATRRGRPYRHVSLRRAPDRRADGRVGRLARPRAAAARRGRAECRARRARGRGGQARRGPGRRGAPRPRRARDRPRARGPCRGVHGARATRARGRAPGPHRRGDSGARRGDDGRARRRVAGLLRHQRRLLHDARRLRAARRPAARDRVVRARRRVHRAAQLHARAVLVPRGVRRTCSSAPATGSARRPCCSPRSRSTAARAGGKNGRTRSRSACSPSCACARGVRRRRSGCSRGWSSSAARCPCWWSCSSAAASSAMPPRCSPRRIDRRVGRLRAARGPRHARAGRGRSRPRARLRGRASARWTGRPRRRCSPAGCSPARAAGEPGALEDGGRRGFAALEFPHEEARAQLALAEVAGRRRLAARARLRARARATRSSGSAPARDADRAAALLRSLGAARPHRHARRARRAHRPREGGARR